MSGIYGKLGIQDNDRSFVNVIGQSVVYEAAAKEVEEHNADLLQAVALFVESETEDYKLRYKLAGGGRMPRRSGQVPSPAVKATGSFDVAFPIEDFGAQVAGDFVRVASARVDGRRHVDGALAVRALDG